MVGGDAASFDNAGFGNPTKEVELPDSHVRGRELGKQEALVVNRSRKPVPEEALQRALHHILHRGEIRPEF